MGHWLSDLEYALNRSPSSAWLSMQKSRLRRNSSFSCGASTSCERRTMPSSMYADCSYGHHISSLGAATLRLYGRSSSK